MCVKAYSAHAKLVFWVPLIQYNGREENEVMTYFKIFGRQDSFQNLETTLFFMLRIFTTFQLKRVDTAKCNK